MLDRVSEMFLLLVNKLVECPLTELHDLLGVLADFSIPTELGGQLTSFSMPEVMRSALRVPSTTVGTLTVTSVVLLNGPLGFSSVMHSVCWSQSPRERLNRCAGGVIRSWCNLTNDCSVRVVLCIGFIRNGRFCGGDHNESVYFVTHCHASTRFSIRQFCV